MIESQQMFLLRLVGFVRKFPQEIATLWMRVRQIVVWFNNIVIFEEEQIEIV